MPIKKLKHGNGFVSVLQLLVHFVVLSPSSMRMKDNRFLNKFWHSFRKQKADPPAPLMTRKSVINGRNGPTFLINALIIWGK